VRAHCLAVAAERPALGALSPAYLSVPCSRLCVRLPNQQRQSKIQQRGDVGMHLLE